jgi:UDP-N-acetylglucosamine transferase subunit ALG13
VIFVTVGTQLAFDRLVRAIDEWAADNQDQDVVIQSGESQYTPHNCEARGYVEPSEWEELFNNAEIIIAHAGMGTILKCLDSQKPLIIMPRLAELGEHRNDHQMATASRFLNKTGILVVKDKHELYMSINRLLSGDYESPETLSSNIQHLIDELRNFSYAGS